MNQNTDMEIYLYNQSYDDTKMLERFSLC